MLPAFLVGFRKFIRVVYCFSWLCPAWLTLFCTVTSLKGPAMIAYDVETKVLDTEIFPQQSLTWTSAITFIVFFSQEKPLRWKEINTPTHTRARTHTHAHIHAHTYTYTVKTNKQILKITKVAKKDHSVFNWTDKEI